MHTTHISVSKTVNISEHRYSSVVHYTLSTCKTLVLILGMEGGRIGTHNRNRNKDLP